MFLFLNVQNTHVLHMFLSKKFKLMWYKMMDKKTLVLHLSIIYELKYLKNFKYTLKKIKL
jgi:hypothetical protein